MKTDRRNWLKRLAQLGQLAGLAALPSVGLPLLQAHAQDSNEQVLQLVARRFNYTPGEIQVVVGRPVVLEFTAIDFMHGFHLPDLKLRADLEPGKVTRVRFTIFQPGTYEFLCDNFCGDEHEQMNGKITAVAA
jgi:cytochrome c oxidase subunit 2